MKTWLDKWEPENEEFWKKTGSKIAWKTLSLPCFAEPPAESPSTRYNSLIAGSFD